MKKLLFVFIPLLALSCHKFPDSPLEKDEDLKHTPEIVRIQSDSDYNLVLYLDYSYSASSTIIIERRSLGGFEQVNYKKLSATALADTSFNKEFDNTFIYRVRVEKGDLRSDYSVEKSYDYISSILNPPQGLKINVFELQGNELTWSDRSGREDGFKIEKNDGSGWQELASLPANTQKYMHSISGIPSLPMALSYRVKAFNNTLASPWVDIATSYTGIGVPTNLRITDTTAYHFTIEWQDNSEIETEYSVERSKNGALFGEIARLNVGAVKYVDKISEKGVYYYRIRAIRESLSSLWSNEVSYKIIVILPMQGLVAYYPFKGNTNDESGKGRNGTAYGATLAADRFGVANSAYNFNGSSYIKASATGLPTGERTTALWFYANKLSLADVVLGYGGNGFSSSGTSWFMHVGSTVFGRHLHWDINNIGYSSQISVENWYHFAATTDQSGSKIFVNGKQKVANGIFINNTYVDGKDLSIGVDVDGYGKAPFTNSDVGYFNGIIDDIMIYNRALSEIEIQALYDEGGWGN